MSDSALNAQVAVALGAVWCQEPLDSEGRAVAAGHPYLAWPHCYGFETRTRIQAPENASEIYEGPEYDTDWASTGPLIEQLRLSVRPQEDCGAICWAARADADPDETESPGFCITPLIAVCELILALKAAGKLTVPEPSQEGAK